VKMNNLVYYKLFINVAIYFMIITENSSKSESKSSQPIYYGPYSSCHMLKETSKEKWSKTNGTNFKWIQGSGQPIKSWISSILPVFADTPAKRKWNHPKGLYATFTSSSSREEKVYEIGHRRLGVLWRRAGTNECDGWLYGRWKLKNASVLKETSENWEFSGGNSQDDASGSTSYQLAYLYQDMTTAIVGKFLNGKLLDGEPRQVIGYQCERGILILKFSKPKKTKMKFKYEESSSTFITSKPKLMDPYEKYNVYVNETTIRGMKLSDGLFAKRILSHFTLVAVYAGTRLNKIEHDKMFAPKNLTGEISDDLQKNLITLDDEITLDIPPKFSNIVDYRSSLGHKVNHNFSSRKVNAEFGLMNHPRFGLVRCVRSTRAIGVGEEIFVNYGYGTDESDEGHPMWYQQGLKIWRKKRS